VATGSGILTATVTFKKASVLTLTILYANGGVIGTVTGGSGFSMAPGVSAGTYSFGVSGASSSFTLTATFPAP